MPKYFERLKKQSKHIDFRALALAVLIFVAFGAKEIHHTLAHAHEEIKICNAQLGETHLHDAEYIAHECPLCDFTFSNFELPNWNFELPKLVVLEIKTDFYFGFSVPNFPHIFLPLRGPPVGLIA